MLINWKLLPRYILFILINSGNSATQGPHQVAHTLINLRESELFFTNSFKPASLMVSIFTGSLAHSWFAFSIQSLFSIHLIEHPKTFVVFSVTSLLPSNSSSAVRVSKLVGVFEGFS